MSLNGEVKFLLDILREEIKELRAEVVVNRNESTMSQNKVLKLQHEVKALQETVGAKVETLKTSTQGKWMVVGFIVNGIFSLMASLIALYKH